ncbi:MAG: hypothetical protein RL649_344 [Actinomycetota bacterium]
MKNNLLLEDEIKEIAEIDYEKDEVLINQRQGAIAVNKLVEEFIKTGEVTDNQLIALTLVRFRDLQVREEIMQWDWQMLRIRINYLTFGIG